MPTYIQCKGFCDGTWDVLRRSKQWWRVKVVSDLGPRPVQDSDGVVCPYCPYARPIRITGRFSFSAVGWESFQRQAFRHLIVSINLKFLKRYSKVKLIHEPCVVTQRPEGGGRRAKSEGGCRRVKSEGGVRRVSCRFRKEQIAIEKARKIKCSDLRHVIHNTINLDSIVRCIKSQHDVNSWR